MTTFGIIVLVLDLFLIGIIVLQHVVIARLTRTLEQASHLLNRARETDLQSQEIEVEIADPHSRTGRRTIRLPMFQRTTTNVH